MFSSRMQIGMYLGLVLVAVSGCGNDGSGDPSNGVARVGDTVIPVSAFEAQLATASPEAGAAPVRYDPPDFARCVAARRRAPPPSSDPPPAAAQLRKQCRREYEQRKPLAMQSAVQAEWIRQEADKHGIEVSAGTVRRAFRTLRRSTWREPGAYRRFLEASGATEADFLGQIRRSLLYEKLSNRAKAAAEPPSDEQVRTYYERNRAQFDQPASRELRLIVAKTQRAGEQAKRALEQGRSWTSVSKEYSTSADVSNGGEPVRYSRGGLLTDLDDEVFSAREGVVNGPVKARFGWSVFAVGKTYPASRRSLPSVRAELEQALLASAQQRAVDRFAKRFRATYRDKTTCADDFRVAECSNAPPAKGRAAQAANG